MPRKRRMLPAMTILLLTFGLAGAAWAGPSKAAHVPGPRCERFFDDKLIPVAKRMKTLRSLESHQGGTPTELMRIVMDHQFPDFFPADVVVMNQTPLPKFDIKAEQHQVNPSSAHTLLILRLPDGNPAVLVHHEVTEDDGSVVTVPLGEAVLRELRDILIESYQLRGPPPPEIKVITPPPQELRRLWLFADDHLRVDPKHSRGMSETDYRDLLQILPVNSNRADAWALALRRDSLGFSLLRTQHGSKQDLEIFEPADFEAAVRSVLTQVREHLGAGAGRPDLDVFLDDDVHPKWTVYGRSGPEADTDVIELIEKHLTERR